MSEWWRVFNDPTLSALIDRAYDQRGWFHDAWHGSGDWERVKVTAEECPHISTEFLAEERQALGEPWFRQEYLCSFEDAVDAYSAIPISKPV